MRTSWTFVSVESTLAPGATAAYAWLGTGLAKPAAAAEKKPAAKPATAGDKSAPKPAKPKAAAKPKGESKPAG